MPEVTHLPCNCSVDDLIEVIERDGAAIVDGFVSDTWLAWVQQRYSNLNRRIQAL